MPIKNTRSVIFGATALMVVAGLLPVGLAEAQEAPNTSSSPTAIQFVVDTSGSMYGIRLTQAKQALYAGVGALDESQTAGLRSYAGSCGNQGVLRVAPGVGNRDAMVSAIDSLSAFGGTPTPDALRGAAADLSGVTGPKAVILISDGQSTCGNPCPVAQALKAELGIDFRAYTIGFQAPSSAESELQCVADVTGGRYYSATDTEGMIAAINDALDGDGYGYVAVGDSTTTGFSVPTCDENRELSAFGCVGSPPAMPYPQRVANDPRFADLERKGIWGYTVDEAARDYLRDRNEFGDWETQLASAEKATELVTVSLGANDMHFSDVKGWLADCIGLNQKKVLGVVYDVSVGLDEDKCRDNAREKANSAALSADLDVMFDALDTAKENGATVVVTEYFNPFNDKKHVRFLPDRSCSLLHKISDIVTDEINAVLVRRASTHGFQTADFKAPFAGHGAGAEDSYVFGTECEVIGGLSAIDVDVDWAWPPVSLGDTSRNIQTKFDPHPNAEGTTAQADAVLEVLS